MAKQIRLYFGYHSGQHSKMAVKLAPSFYTAAVKCLEQETANASELESAARGSVRVKVDNNIMYVKTVILI